MKVTKSYIKQLVKEELEAVMYEGYAGMKYKRNPSLRPTHPSDKREAPDFSKPSIQMTMSIADILRDNTILGFSQSAEAAKEIVKEFDGKMLEEESLKDFLMKNTVLKDEAIARVAKEIVKEMNK